MPDAMRHPYIQFEGTKAWLALDAELSALVKNGDVIEQTDRIFSAAAQIPKVTTNAN